MIARFWTTLLLLLLLLLLLRLVPMMMWKLWLLTTGVIHEKMVESDFPLWYRFFSIFPFLSFFFHFNFPSIFFNFSFRLFSPFCFLFSLLFITFFYDSSFLQFSPIYALPTLAPKKKLNVHSQRHVIPTRIISNSWNFPATHSMFG